MIPVTSFKGRKVALFGLGGSGMITARALVLGGAEVVAWDDNPASVARAQTNDIFTADLREFDLSEMEALVLAPGVPLTHPKPHWVVEQANQAGIPIIGDVELFARERRLVAPNSEFVAITGTNGKSTTTALISHVLRESGCNVQMGGNIGRAVLSLDAIADDCYYVIECSSYQIDLAPSLDPTIGILLNLAPDHLDRHGTMQHYAEVKKQLVAKSAWSVIGADDEYCRDIATSLKQSGRDVEMVTAGQGDENFPNVDYQYADGCIQHCLGEEKTMIADLHGIHSLRGAHNGQNAAAAFATCHRLGFSQAEIQSGLNSFGGLVHRMEQVTEFDGVLFINDSKATNVEAAATALSSFDDIFWIAGGLAKQGGIASLEKWFGRIHHAYLIGEAAPEFAAQLGDKVPFEISGNLEQAVANGFAAAREFSATHRRPVALLLSPACASFDQYANFEVRGEAFKDAVSSLLKSETA